MYIYELPFDINKELCRLLDNDDDWKELAGVYMKYSPFDVNVSMLIIVSHPSKSWGFPRYNDPNNFIGNSYIY